MQRSLPQSKVNFPPVIMPGENIILVPGRTIISLNFVIIQKQIEN